ncbi:MAG: DinB family protein [Gemmatimonadaceae bacterium]
MLARDLRALGREVDAYPSDDLLWHAVPGISNSAGTLVLHLVGNLQHFIGAVLGQSGYVRDRDAEFATRDLTRAELRSRIEAAAESVDTTLARVTDELCDSKYPVPVGGRELGTGEFLMHLVAHLAYHLGQVDYHRRMLVPDAGTVDAVSIGELRER